MMMKSKLLFIIFLILLIYPASSQRIGNIWYFGIHCGITFDTPDGRPIAIGGNNDEMWEGCATVSNDAGTVDLYTDGIKVYNKLNGLMATQLSGGSSSTQSVIIVPKPGDSLIYYLFTTDAFENQKKKTSKGLNYSVVDMRANGGLGSIINANIKLLDSTLEKVTFVRHRDKKSAWIIGHSYNTDEFYSYLLDNLGLHPPVISKAAPVAGDNGITGDRGYLKASIDGTKLAAAYIQNLNVYLYDFDNSTGIVSNGQMLFPANSELQFYGVEFSPDGSKLYASFLDLTRGIYQLDLSSGDIAKIRNSAVLILDEKGFTPAALQLGPDGRIYAAHSETPYLHVIDYPDRLYPQCNLKIDAVYLDFDNSGRKCKLGLPNAINAIFFINAKATASNPACEGDTVFLYANVDASTKGYTVKWSGPNGFKSSSEDTMIVNAKKSNSGWYYVEVTLGGKVVSDSVYVLVADSPFTNIKSSSPTTFCQGDSTILSAFPYNASLNYLWSTGETSKDIVIRKSGRYYLNVKNAGNCEYRDSVDITVVQPPIVKILARGKTNFCDGDSVRLEASPFDPNINYKWSTGETSSSIIVRSSGNYKLWGTNKNSCIDSSEINVNVQPVLVAKIAEGTNVQFCKGDSATLNAEPRGLRYFWSNGSSSQSIVVKQPGKYWVKVENQNECEDTAFTLVEFYPESILEIRGNTTFCKGDSTLLSAYGNFKSYEWSTGETSQSIYIKTKGKINLKAIDYYGCISYDTVNLNVFELQVDDHEIKNIDFGRVYIDSDSIITVRIYNNDATQFVVSDITFGGAVAFSHVNNLPVPVASGDYVEIKIKFVPFDIIDFNDSIFIYITEPCKLVLHGFVHGTGIVKMIASLPDTSGRIGETDFCMPLSAFFKTNRNISNQSDWRASISHNLSVFVPNPGILNMISAGTRIAKLNGNDVVTNKKSKISDYCGTILLDENVTSIIKLDSLQYNNPNVIVELKDGSLTTNGICVRNLSQIVRLDRIKLKIAENPARDKISFEISNAGDNKFSASLYDNKGELVIKLDNLSSSNGKQNIDISTDNLSVGIYFLVVSTLNESIIEKIIVFAN